MRSGPRPAGGVHRLLRVQLDDQLFVDILGDVLALRQVEEFPLDLITVYLESSRLLFGRTSTMSSGPNS
jgi:hypothetical protein